MYRKAAELIQRIPIYLLLSFSSVDITHNRVIFVQTKTFTLVQYFQLDCTLPIFLLSAPQ